MNCKHSEGNTQNIASVNKIVMLKTTIVTILICSLTIVQAGCNKQQDNELIKAACSNNMSEVTRLLGAGANPNDRDDTCAGADTTALHGGAMQADKAIVEVLIQNGAQVNAKGKGGQSPLHSAALAGNTGAAEALIANGADVNARNFLRSTPLHRAVSGNNYAGFSTPSDFAGFVRLLIAHGADVNARDNSQYTPLHYAVAWGWYPNPDFKPIIQALLAKGADVNAKDRYGRTPMTLAHGKPEIIALLTQYDPKE